MPAVEILSRLRELGIRLWLDKGMLRYEAPKGVMTKELLSQISVSKGEIIAFLEEINTNALEDKEIIPCVERNSEKGLPLSFAQQSMWFFDRFTKGNPVFNICNAMTMRGTLYKDKLLKALNELVARHESMRTTFKNVDGMPVQVVHAALPITLQEINFCGIPKDELDNMLKQAIKEEARRAFDLETGPLFRFCIFTLEENTYAFCMTTHHIISDAWSNAIFFNEFLKLYKAYVNEEDITLPKLQLQYADYAVWERIRFEEKMPKKLLDYWIRQLANPTTLQLPTDFPRSKSKNYEGKFQPLSVPADIVGKLKAIGKTEGVSMFMIILSAFQTLLYRYSGQTDIFTGTVVANRNKKEVENLVGVFMNTIVLRTSFDDDPSFIDILRRVKQVTLDAYTYQELPFDKLLEEIKPERDVSMTPLFQVMFILQNTQKVELELPKLKMQQLDVESGMAPFDLRLQLTETEGALKGGFDYSAALFKTSTVERIGGHLLNILKYVANEPEKKVADIPILTIGEQDQILTGFNNTDATYLRKKVISRFFEEQTEKTPDYAAAMFEDERLTYRELNERSNQLARLLREKGINRGSIVAIMLERSLEMIIGILAIEKAGGTYLPVDPNYPNERINYILKDSGAALLLLCKKFDSVETGVRIEKLFIEDKNIYKGNCSDVQEKPAPDDIAYIIYTSGSTGRPKGTMIEHHSLINRLEWMQKKYPISSKDTILQKTTFTFDVSVWEIFWAGTQGARMCLLEPGAEKDPKKIVDAIEKNNITVIHFVPSMLTAFLEYLEDTGETQKIACLRQVFTSGEALTPAQVGLFNSLLRQNGTRLANLYGPTEATIDVSYFDCEEDNCQNSVPIGKPIDNIKLYVVDKKMQLQPIGVPGELCIAGVGLAKGYLNKPELTAEKFIDNPFCQGKKLYRTGDLAKWREDGNIEYLGRLDFQVKIHGLRIELGEIENTILLHPDVKECVVNAWNKQPGDLHLAAYVVCAKGKSVDASIIEKFLSKTLPDYMIPRIYMFLDAMPLSTNGKADRKALPKPVLEKKAEYVAPSSDVENIISEIWEKELGLDSIGVNDNFFEIGGHSLLLTRVNSRLNKQFNREFPLIDLFSYPTISSLAKYITGGKNEAAFLKNEERIKKQKEALLMKRQKHRR